MNSTIEIRDGEGVLIGCIISKDGKITIDGDREKIKAILWGPLTKAS